MIIAGRVCVCVCVCVFVCVCICGGKCVIIILICWLWLSGRLPTEETHLVNETSRSSGRQTGREEEKEEETERWKCEKVVTTREEEKWRKRKRYMEAGRATPMPKCLMKCWANEVLAVYAINSNSNSNSNSIPPLPSPPAQPSPTWQRLDSQSDCRAAAPVKQVRNPIFTQRLLSGSTDPILSLPLSHGKFKWGLAGQNWPLQGARSGYYQEIGWMVRTRLSIWAGITRPLWRGVLGLRR